MLMFEKLTYKNFLSTGNAPIVIELNRTKTTQIVGLSGHGKSTICDAICFGLFGKAFRNINKNQLINSVNLKHCLVEIEFKVNGMKSYRIVRGMKPNIFEIWENGILINQESKSKDYQEYLEHQILGLNFKVFCQSVILGSASFVPFMQLTPASRREIIEDILDIKIFSEMNVLLKSQIQDTKNQLTAINEKIEQSKIKIIAQKRLIDSLESNQNENLEHLRYRMDDLDAELNDLEQEIVGYNEQKIILTTDLYAMTNTKDHLSSLIRVKNKLDNAHDGIMKSVQFLTANDSCPVCFQSIDEDHRSEQLGAFNKILLDNEEEQEKLTLEIDGLNRQMESFRGIVKQLKDFDDKIAKNRIKMEVLSNQMQQYKDEMMALRTSKNDSILKAERGSLKQLVKESSDYQEEKGAIHQTKQIQDIITILLKDTGVKTAIIKEYLPIINNLINKYLHDLDLFIQFELDEAFSETIRSRYRDEFSYSSFSEGEKARINIAILFTWREIARLKNSVNTNLLIMDEVLDNSLDEFSLEHFMNLIKGLRDSTNLFIISHRNTHSDRFNEVIRIEKQGNFSERVEQKH